MFKNYKGEPETVRLFFDFVPNKVHTFTAHFNGIARRTFKIIRRFIIVNLALRHNVANVNGLGHLRAVDLTALFYQRTTPTEVEYKKFIGLSC